MKKFVDGQVIGVQMVAAADGTAFTSAVTVVVTVDGGTQSPGGGTGPTHEGNGFFTYLPTQAETNGDHVGFTFTGSGAIPTTVQVYTTFPQTGDSFARIGATGSGLTTLATAASVAALPAATDIVTGGAITTSGGAVSTVTTVGTTTTNTDMRGTDNAALATALATAQLDLDTITGTDGATLATAQALYAPAKATDIVTGGAITTSAGAVSNVTTVATTTTNTDMRGTDSAALASALATAQLDLDTITGVDGVTLATAQALYAPAKATDIVSGGAITTSGGAVSSVTLVGTTTTNTDMITAAAVNAEVVDALATDTYAEPAAVPAATASLKDKIGWLCMLARNKLTQTATTQIIAADDTTTTVGTSTVSDDGTTATRGEFS